MDEETQKEMEILAQIQANAFALVSKIYKTNLWRSAVWKKEFVALHSLLYQETLEL